MGVLHYAACLMRSSPLSGEHVCHEDLQIPEATLLCEWPVMLTRPTVTVLQLSDKEYAFQASEDDARFGIVGPKWSSGPAAPRELRPARGRSG